MNFIKHFYPFNPAEKQQRPTLTHNTVWFKPCNRPKILNSDTLDAEILASKMFHIFLLFFMSRIKLMVMGLLQTYIYIYPSTCFTERLVMCSVVIFVTFSTPQLVWPESD